MSGVVVQAWEAEAGRTAGKAVLGQPGMCQTVSKQNKTRKESSNRDTLELQQERDRRARRMESQQINTWLRLSKQPTETERILFKKPREPKSGLRATQLGNKTLDAITISQCDRSRGQLRRMLAEHVFIQCVTFSWDSAMRSPPNRTAE